MYNFMSTFILKAVGDFLAEDVGVILTWGLQENEPCLSADLPGGKERERESESPPRA